MLWAALALGLTLPTAPGAVSFAPGLLKPIPAAEGVLRRLRSAGTAHLAAVAMYQEDTEADLLKGGDLLDALLTTTATAEPSASPEIVKALGAKDWVHVCGTVKELAAAKRVGARTLWLNAAAAADEHSKTFSDEEIERAQAAGLAEPQGYVARGIIADLADAVCDRLEALPEALVSLQAAMDAEREAARGDEDEPPAGAAAAVGSAESGTTAERAAASLQEQQQYCVGCGAKLPSRARFCPACGDECGITLL